MAAARAGGPLFIQFARAPEPGQVKTRMQPALDAAQACDLHRDLVLWTARNLIDAQLAPVELWVTGDMDAPLFRDCLALGMQAVRPQQGNHLGERMHAALADGLGRHDQVVLVGSDCPGIDSVYLKHALDALGECPVVLGPALDGGYVLIGTTEVDSRWFEDVNWGSAEVYGQTLARLRAAGADWRALAALQDIDRPEDLSLWRDIAGGNRAG